jgi:hypothetical protein
MLAYRKLTKCNLLGTCDDSFLSEDRHSGVFEQSKQRRYVHICDWVRKAWDSQHRGVVEVFHECLMIDCCRHEHHLECKVSC